MPRKEKLDPDVPPPPRTPANKYNRWRRAVEEMLTARWQRGSLDVESVAATVVGMFDAGATDAEVVAFLRAQELAEDLDPWLTDDERNQLVRELHRSAE